MATARRTQRAQQTRRRPRVSGEPKTAVEVAAAAPPATDMPSAHNLGAELEAIAAAAGRFWHALGESGIPNNFRNLLFDNWQAGVFANDNAASVNDQQSETEGDGVEA